MLELTLGLLGIAFRRVRHCRGGGSGGRILGVLGMKWWAH
ncbi:unnamed protein product [Acidithrix sp. C25]|nr:unnamed protein product [Acidithrix sp. C25]